MPPHLRRLDRKPKAEKCRELPEASLLHVAPAAAQRLSKPPALRAMPGFLQTSRPQVPGLIESATQDHSLPDVSDESDRENFLKNLRALLFMNLALRVIGETTRRTEVPGLSGRGRLERGRRERKKTLRRPTVSRI